MNQQRRKKKEARWIGWNPSHLNLSSQKSQVCLKKNHNVNKLQIQNFKLFTAEKIDENLNGKNILPVKIIILPILTIEWLQ